MYQLQAMILLLPVLAAIVPNYLLLEGNWVMDVDRTVQLAVSEKDELKARESFRKVLTGVKLRFDDGLIQRTAPSGKIAGPEPYTVRPVSGTEFEIMSSQSQVLMIATELTDHTLCIRYVAPASPEEAEKAFALECFTRDDA